MNMHQPIPIPRITSAMLAISLLSTAAFAQRAIDVTPVATTSEGGQRWALIVGINDYANVPRLQFARQDATALRDAIVQRCGFPERNVVLMTDTSNPRSPHYPTIGNLRNQINNLAQIARKNDLLLVFFSGHGVNIDGQGYLVPVDGSDRDVATLVPLSWIRTTIETSAAAQRVLVLDSCHSGAKSGPGDSAAGTINAAVAAAAFATLASCDTRQVSYEDNGQGVFTRALIEGLAGHADLEAEGNRDGIVTVTELFEFAALRVRQWSLTSGKVQTPVLKGEFKGRVELARFTPSSGTTSTTITPSPSEPDAFIQPEPAALRGYYDMMANELYLTDDQQAELAEVAAEKARAESSWKEQNKDKIDELNASVAKARKAKDKAAESKALGELAELNKGSAGIAAAYNDKINNILTHEQRAGWVSMKLYLGAMQRYARARLTDDQKAYAKKLSDGLGGTGIGKSDAELADLRNRLHKLIEEKVLTTEQRHFAR